MEFAVQSVLSWLQEFFQQHGGEFRWSPDEKLSRIQISDQHTVNLEQVEQKPSIVANLKGVRPFKRHIGESVGGGLGQRTRHSILCEAPIHFLCSSRVGAEAGFLAGTVFQFFEFFAPDMARFFRVQDVYADGFGEEVLTKMDSGQEVIVVPAPIRLYFPIGWLRSDHRETPFGALSFQLFVQGGRTS